MESREVEKLSSVWCQINQEKHVRQKNRWRQLCPNPLKGQQMTTRFGNIEITHDCHLLSYQKTDRKR